MNSSRCNFLPYDTTDENHPLLLETLKEINETIETRTKCLEIFRKQVKNLKDIEPCLEDDFLLGFLRVAKYDTTKALERLIRYYQHFEVYLDSFKKIIFPFHEADKIRHIKLSPYRCRDNSFLLFANPDIDYKKYTFGHRFYLEMCAVEKLFENPVNQICGGTYIIDCEGMGIQGYLACKPFWLWLLVTSLTNTFPIRMKALHIVNMPAFFPLIVKICYPFMSKKIQSRVICHAKNADMKDLHSHISPDVLPEKFGGKLKQEELIDWMDNLKEMQDNALRLFAFGNIKTKSARQAMKVIQ